MRIKMRNPETMPKPAGAYSHVARVSAGDLLFIAGQVAVDVGGKMVDGDFEAQAAQVFANLRAALRSEGADFKDVVQFTTYLVDSRDIAKLRKYRDRVYPTFFPDGKYPPNTLLVVDRLASEDMRLEIAAIAAP
ncbi:MAG TPA: RidA family protein [Burkholderiales bacterium]|nr:RidA family protein [Burkholderiales bacterium]